MAQIYWFCGHEQFQPEILVQQAVQAEAAGFDGVMVSEHFHPWVADAGAGGFAFATLGAMAVATKRIKLMTAVTTPLFRYHPAVVAQAAATIDRLSGGRFELGVGTGENINEGALGYAFPPYAERAERMGEALHLMRELLTGDSVDFSGKYYQTKSAKLYSPPIHDIPIYLAAGGPKTAAMAGKSADGVIVSVKDTQDASEKIIMPARGASGKADFKLVANRWSVYGTSQDDAWQALSPWRGLRAPSRLSATDPAELQREADEIPRDEIMSRYTQIRSLEDYIPAYSPLISDLGADIIGIQTTSTNQEALIRELGRNILPELRKLTPSKH